MFAVRAIPGAQLFATGYSRGRSAPRTSCAGTPGPSSRSVCDSCRWYILRALVLEMFPALCACGGGGFGVVFKFIVEEGDVVRIADDRGLEEAARCAAACGQSALRVTAAARECSWCRRT